MDWSQTPLGPISGWPQSLRTALGMVGGAQQPTLLCWGPESVLFYNDATARLLGARHPAALGARGVDAFGPRWEELGAAVQRVTATRSAVDLEDLLRPGADDGAPRAACLRLRVALLPVMDEAFAVGGVLGLGTEIAGPRREEPLGEASRAPAPDEAAGSALPGAEARAQDFRAVVEASSDFISFGNPDGSIAYLNPAGKRLVGFPEGRSVNAAEVFPPDVAEQQMAAMFPTVIAGGYYQGETLFQHFETGERIPMLQDTFGCFDEQGQLMLVATISRDRRERKRAEAEREKLLAELAANAEALKALDHAKTAFFSNVSHEFRTPLTLILGPLEAALASPTPSLSGDALERVHGNAQRLLRLVNALLEFSRVEAGRAAPRLRPTDLARTTAGLAHAFESVVMPAGLALHVDCPPLPQPVWVDPELWEKVVLNLVSNAFKFTHEGHIAVRQRWTGDGIELRVEDSGTGIPSAALPRLFERFHRVEGAKGRSIEGSGIGLSLVKSLVELHGGRIQVESTPGVGSAFTVTLPARPPGVTAEEATLQTAVSEAPQATATAFVREASQWATETATETARPLGTAASAAAREGRVLLVDDNADMRRYVADLLAPRFDVETSVDGMSALEAARAAPPDVVVSDLMMPGMDGFALARALRAEEGTRAVPVILCSARADEDAKVEALGAGATDYLVKPVGARELLARVESAVKVGRAAAARLKEQDRLRSILEQAPAAICLLDGPEHRYTMANARYLELVGGREVLGKTVAEALPEVVEQGFIALLDTVYRTGEPQLDNETRVELQRADGAGLREVRLNLIYQPVTDAAGQTQFIFVHAVDVTELVRARERAAALARDAETRAGFEQQLIGLVSHDLRNPLGAIGFGAAMLLQNKSLDPRVARTVTRIQSSTERAQRMVSDLLDFTQVRLGGGLPMNPRPLDLAPFLRQLCEEVQTNHRDRLIVVQADGPCPGEVDSDRIAQVVVNLLSNALKYGDHAVPVTVRLEDLGRSVRLRVHNGGKPIPPDVKARLFEPMQRGSTIMEAGGRSVGLGLYISQHIVQAHGGTIGVTSTAAEGTTFTVTLPRRAQVQDGHASATN